MAVGLTNYNLVAFKEEVTSGTFVQPLLADANLKAFDIDFPDINTNNESLGNPADGKFNSGQTVPGKIVSGVTVKFPFKFDNTLNDPGSLEKMLKAAGFISTAGTPHVYSWNGEPDCTTLSAHFQSKACDGTYQIDQLKGMRFAPSIEAAAVGSQLALNLTGLGGYVAEVDTDSIANIDAGAVGTGNVFLNAPVTIDSNQYVCKNMALASNASMVDRDDSGELTGVINGMYSGPFDWTLTMQLEDFVVTDSLFDKLLAGEVFTTGTKISLGDCDINITESSLREVKRNDYNNTVVRNVVLEIRAFNITRK